MVNFEIYDELHAEHIAEFPTLKEAVLELKRISKLPWDKEPNRAPCTGWKTCGRTYVINEFIDSAGKSTLVRAVHALDIGHGQNKWDPKAELKNIGISVE